MKGRLKQHLGALVALLLCVSLCAPAAAAEKSVTEIANAALELIYSHEGTYGSVNANDSGAVSVGKIQWHGDRALGVVRLTIRYMTPERAVSILGQTFYDEIMAAASWETRSVNSEEAAALSALLSTDAGVRAQDEQGLSDVSGYVRAGQNVGLTRPEVLVYFCDMYNQWPIKAVEVAKTAVTAAGSGANVTLDGIHSAAMSSALGSSANSQKLRSMAYSYCKNLDWATLGNAGAATRFSDVPEGSWYAAAVTWAVDMGVTNGTGGGRFSPDQTCTRAQAVTFLWRAMGSLEPTTTVQLFKDVSPDDYYYKAVVWASEQGITEGTGDGYFSPDAPCTRAHVVTFLWRAENCPTVNGAMPFGDVAADSYCSSAVLWAANKGVTTGSDSTTFAPDAPCTRAHIVTFLYRDLVV